MIDKISKEEKPTFVKSTFECDEYSMFYDKEGKKVSLKAWNNLMMDQEYKIVASDMIGDCHISTVWFGLNNSFYKTKAPIIFETMIFGGKFEEENYMETYCTEEEALKGHKRAVELVKKEGG